MVRDVEWQEFFAFLARPIGGGVQARGRLMRRRQDGIWEYRRPTPEDEAKLEAENAL